MRKQEGLLTGTERRTKGLLLALRDMARRAIQGILAYLSLPRSLKWIFKEFGDSKLAIWKELE